MTFFRSTSPVYLLILILTLPIPACKQPVSGPPPRPMYISTSNTENLTTTEAGGTDYFWVFLSQAPTSDVRIALSCDPSSEASVSPATLLFTPADWSARRVNITGLDDPLVDGSQTYSICLHAAESDDPDYSGLDAPDVPAVNVDDDSPDLVILPLGIVRTSESGGDVLLDARLNTAPAGDVTVDLSSSNELEGTVSPVRLTFSPDNWDISQTITLSPVDDPYPDGFQSYFIVTDPLQSADSEFDGVDPADVNIVSSDDDGISAAGDGYVMFIEDDGSLWACGENSSGRLGDGTTTDRASPIRIGSDTDWAYVASGGSQSLALKENGTLWSWGSNSYSELGRNTYSVTNREPRQVGSDSDWSMVDGGPGFSAALKLDGSVWFTGYSVRGGRYNVFTRVSSRPMRFISAGSRGADNYIAGIDFDGRLWIDGEGDIGTDTDWTWVDCGDWHTLAGKSDGSLWAWGDNRAGQLGDGTTTDRSSPTLIDSGPGWIHGSAGDRHSSAVKTGGSLWIWGENAPYAWDDGASLSWGTEPAPVSGASVWELAFSGDAHTLLRDSSGNLSLMGINSSGQLGAGYFPDRDSAADIGAPFSASLVRVGEYCSFAVADNGTLWAWGMNDFGVLGTGDRQDIDEPEQVGSAATWRDIALGGNHMRSLHQYVVNEVSSSHALGLRTDGTLWAWGENGSGQLGDASNDDRLSPVQIGTGTDWAAVAAGGTSSWGVKSNGTLWAWGYNYDGRLGTGDKVSTNSPVQVGDDTDWESIETGVVQGPVLALKTDGSLWTWTGNPYGAAPAPGQLGSETDWKEIDVGAGHYAAIKDNGSLWCWGSNNSGQVGDGTTTTRSDPVQVGTDTDWATVSAGVFATMAVKTDGTLWAWGSNEHGQIALGSTSGASSPTRVGSADDWHSVEAGLQYGIGRKTGGSVYSWGRNNFGQLGDGRLLVLEPEGM